MIARKQTSIKVDPQAWKDVELDNFGKIAIGLSKHDYDDEDYSNQLVLQVFASH